MFRAVLLLLIAVAPSIALAQTAGAAPAAFRLMCASTEAGCASCAVIGGTPQSRRALMAKQNVWTLRTTTLRLAFRNRPSLSLCELKPVRHSVRIDIRERRTIRTLTATVTVKADKDSPSPNPPSTNLLRLSNLEYLGTALLPQTANGFSTGYSTGLLAARKTSGGLSFFTDTHIYSRGQIHEVVVPAFAASGVRPMATLVKSWGSIYGNKRVDDHLTPYPSGPPVNGLLWDPVRGGLWWTYAEHYNTLNRLAPSLGFTQFNADGSITPIDAQRIHEQNRSNHWTRGCVIQIPARYSTLLGTKRLAAGCGGYYSIIGGGSWGPSLTAFDPDKPAERKTILGYPVADDIRAPRPADYFMSDTAGSGSGWMGKNPSGGSGLWTGADEVGGEGGAGGAVWLDLPQGRGVLVWANHGTGRIGYDSGSITSGGRINRLYIYDPDDLVAAYNGATVSPLPKTVVDWPIPEGYLGGRLAGVAQDPDDPSVFYIAHTYAYKDGVEFYPVIHKYRVVTN